VNDAHARPRPRPDVSGGSTDRPSYWVAIQAVSATHHTLRGPMSSTPSDVTRLLQLWTDGDREGWERQRSPRWADVAMYCVLLNERIIGELQFP
jgi:hypothetical protein